MPSFLALLPGSDWKHPNTQLQSAWNFARVGFVFFPLLPLVGVILVLISLVKTWKNSGGEIIQHRLNWGFALLSPWLILVSALGIQPGDALLGLANFLPFFGLFTAFSTLIQSPAQLRQLVWIFMLPALPIMCLGFLQMLGWGGTLSIPGTQVYIWQMYPHGSPLGRMSSVFMHANSLAPYLQMVFIFTLGLLADIYQQNLNKIKDGRISICWRLPVFWWLISILVLCIVSLILTSSRGAWGAVISTSLVFTIYQGWYWIVGIFTAIVTLILSAAYAPDSLNQPIRLIVPRYLWARINDEMYSADRPDALTRVAQWKFAWKLTKSRPLTGWGLQSFGPLYQESTHIWLGYPHNLLLMLSSNLGVPATIAIFGLVGWVLTQSMTLFLNFPIEWRSERTIFFTYLLAFLGFIIINITDATIIELRLNTYAWLILSSISGVVYHFQSIVTKAKLTGD